jgi:hypothetical protein
LTNYERIKDMSEKQLTRFLVDFCVLQLPLELRRKAKTKKFYKKVERFLKYEVDYNEYDDRNVII